MADNINVLVNLIARAQGVGAATKAMTGLQASAVGAEKASANLGRTAIGSKQAFASITNQMRATARPMGDVGSLMASMSAQGVHLNQVSTDTATAFRSIRHQMAGVEGPLLAAEGATTRLSAAQNDFNDITARYANYDMAGTLLTVAAAVTALGAATAVAFAVQERAFTEVERILSFDDVSTEGIQNLRGELMALSEEIPVAFSEVSEIAAFGAALDIGAADLDEFSDTVARFSAVTGASTELAGKGLARLAQYTRDSTPSLQDATRFEQLGSAILLLGNSSIATEEEVLKFSQSISPLGIRSGVAADQIVAMAAATASFASINVEGAGSAFSRVFANIDRDVAEGGASLESFADIAGTTAGQFQAMWAEDAGGAFNRVISGLAQDVPNLTSNLDALGIRNERDRRVVQALAANYDEYARYLGMSNDAMVEGTALGQAYSYVADDLASKWQIFLNVIQNTAAQVGEVLAPVFSGFLSVATDVFNGLGDFASSPFGGWVVRIAGAIAGMVAAWAAWRGMIALATAGALAFRTATAFMGGPGIARGAQGLVAAITGTGVAAQAATPKVAALNATVATGGAAAGRMRGAMASAATFIGGPWGLLIGAGIAAGATLFAHLSAEAEKARDKVIDAMTDASESTKGFEQAAENVEGRFPGAFLTATAAVEGFGSVMGRVDDLLGATSNSWLGGWSLDLQTMRSEFGMTQGEATSFQAALREVGTALNNASDDPQTLIAGFQSLRDDLGATDSELFDLTGLIAGDARQALIDYGRSIDITGSDQRVLNEVLHETDAATRAAEEGTSLLAAEQAIAAEEAQAHADALAEALDAFREWTTATREVSNAQDDLQSSLNESDRNVEAFLNRTGDWENWAGSAMEALTGTSDASISLRKTFDEVADGYRNVGATAKEQGLSAAEAAQMTLEGRDALLADLEALGLNREEAEKWADERYGSAQDVVQGLEEVYDQALLIDGTNVSVAIDGDIDKWIEENLVVEEDIANLSATTAIVDIDGNPVGFNTDAESTEGRIAFLNGEWVTIDMDGNTKPFDADDQHVMRRVTLANGESVLIPYDADADDFNAVRNAVMEQVRKDQSGNDVTIRYHVQFSSSGDQSVRAYMPDGSGGNITMSPGWASGGYTGPGGKYTPAGIVHKGEYVIPKHQVNQSTGLPYADALGKLQRGAEGPSYASGGYVNPSVSFPSALALTPGTIQQIAQAVQHLTVLDSRDVARAANRGNSTFKQTGAY